MTDKLALQADLWYNVEVNIVALGGAVNTPSRINLSWRSIVDSLSQNTPRGKRRYNLKPSRQLLLFCIDCGEEDLSKFYYRPDGTRKGNVCKSCANERIYAKQYNHKTEPRLCPLCGESDPEKFRYKRNGYRNGNLCKACQNERTATIRANMPFDQKEQVKAQARETFRRRASGQRDRMNQRARELYVTERRQAKRARRSTHKTQAGGAFTIREWKALKAHYSYACLCCGRKEPEIKLTADHVIPVSKGGTSNIDNIQPLCLSCNDSKGAKTLDYRTYEKEVCSE